MSLDQPLAAQGAEMGKETTQGVKTPVHPVNDHRRLPG